MVFITMSTIGFTEVREMGDAGRLWTVLIGVAGIGTFAYAAGSLIEFAVEGTVRGYFRKRRMRAEIDRLKDHYILCGYGRVGREVAEELTAAGVPYTGDPETDWWLDNQPDILERIRKLEAGESKLIPWEQVTIVE